MMSETGGMGQDLTPVNDFGNAILGRDLEFCTRQVQVLSGQVEEKAAGFFALRRGIGFTGKTRDSGMTTKRITIRCQSENRIFILPCAQLKSFRLIDNGH